MRFELCLMGQNISVQKEYWEFFRNTAWNKNVKTMPQYSVLEVCLEKNIDFTNKEFMTDKIFNNAISLAEEIQNFLIGLTNWTVKSSLN